MASGVATMRKYVGGLWVVVLVGLAFGCGADSNFNQVWGSDEDRADSLVKAAQIAYDDGDFESAEKFGRRAYAINNDNEKAAVVLGYTYLSLGGIDPFELARKLYSLGGDTATSGTNLQSSESSSGTADLLSNLGSLINLSDEDVDLLGDPIQNNDFFNEANGTTLTQPATVTDTLREQIDTLKYMTRAITYICPFVDHDPDVNGEVLQNPADSRHTCTATKQTRKNRAQSHFLWAFSHLTEALVFQTVLLQAQETVEGAQAEQNNFQKGAEQFKNASLENLGALVSGVKSIQQAIDAVFQFDEPNSQINVTIRNLEAVELAFGRLTGLPTNITSSITKNLEKIRNVGNQIDDSNSELSDEEKTGQALKGQITEKAAKEVSTKIDQEFQTRYQGDISKVPAGDLAQLKEACTAYEDLAKGLDTTKNPDPTACTAANSVQ